jgi:hypothetical protein
VGYSWYYKTPVLVPGSCGYLVLLVPGSTGSNKLFGASTSTRTRTPVPVLRSTSTIAEYWTTNVILVLMFQNGTCTLYINVKRHDNKDKLKQAKNNNQPLIVK